MNRRAVLVLSVLVAVAATTWFLLRDREAARRTRARAEMTELRKAIGIYSSLGSPFREHPVDSRLPMTQAAVSAIDIEIDPWGHEYLIETVGRSVTITCFGADGEPGGEGADEDIVLHWPAPKDPSPR